MPKTGDHSGRHGIAAVHGRTSQTVNPKLFWPNTVRPNTPVEHRARLFETHGLCLRGLYGGLAVERHASRGPARCAHVGGVVTVPEWEVKRDAVHQTHQRTAAPLSIACCRIGNTTHHVIGEFSV